MEKRKEISQTSDSVLPSTIGPEYQLGFLTLVYMVMTLIQFVVFGAPSFQVIVIFSGLIASLVICRNVRVKFIWDRRELIATIAVFSALIFTLILVLVSVEPYEARIPTEFFLMDDVMMAPVVEEIFSTLFLLNLLFLLTGRRLQALFMGSIVWMVLHVTAYFNNVPALFYTFIFSFIAGVVFLYSRNLSYTVALHSVNNMIVFYRYYLPAYAIAATPLLLLMITFPAFAYVGKHWNKIRSSILFSRNWYWSTKQSEGDGGLAAACLIMLSVAGYVFLFPLYVYSNGSARFYMLGSLGWSPFQIPIGMRLAQPDPLLLPVVSILFSIGLILLLADGIHRKRPKKEEKLTKRRSGSRKTSDLSSAE